MDRFGPGGNFRLDAVLSSFGGVSDAYCFGLRGEEHETIDKVAVPPRGSIERGSGDIHSGVASCRS
jgi:hypothetical protein